MKLHPRSSERLMPMLVTSWQHIQYDIGKYAFAGRFVEHKSVLDIGCGTGYGSSFLLKKGAAKVTGADLSAEAIGYADARYRKEGLSFVIADAQQMPFRDESFDTVVALETIEHLPNHRAFLSECCRVLRAGGILLCSTPNKDVSGKPKPYHMKEFTIAEFHQLLEPYFDKIVFYGYVRYKKKGIKEKLINVLVSLLYSLPDLFQTVILKLVALVTRFVFRGYYPIKLEDIDEEDFDKLISDEYRPFPLGEAVPEYVFALGQKARGKG